MTGRRLYERFTDTAAHIGCQLWARDKTVLPHPDKPPVAWAYLHQRDRDVWNELARRISPKPKRKART